MLEVKKLNAGYQKQAILRDVSISVGSKEIVGIVGESGSGKSTLLKSIISLPGSGVGITGGDIIFNGVDIIATKEKQLRKIRGKDICMIFQKPEAAMDPVVKIKDQLYETVFVHNKDADKAETTSRMNGLLTALRFDDPERVLNSYPFELSGGMNQRVALAMALLNNPKLILADEPTSALDVTVQSQVVRIMMGLTHEYDTSILIVTHNMNVVAHMVDKLGVMYGGRLVEFGTRQEVIDTPLHPYTKALLKAIPQIDGKMPVGIEGRSPAFHEIGEGCAFFERCSVCSQQCKDHFPEINKVSDTHWYYCYK